ncbi:uncharacterized protein LOC128500695 [Spea bombifrons]|uniref:uncharacterized protein LOC128500695 n=1 Tax=Spea bombifrons TaxID=233779 RepID=UPI00234A105D|nr:uncharacterized protein LOC128500695 [Spea bombifrons]
MRDFLTTRNQNSWKELIEKEKLARLTWKLNYSEEHPGKPWESRRKRREVPVPNAGAVTLPPIKASQPPPAKSPKQTDQENADIRDLSIMRPVSPRTASLRYDGYSQEGKGRVLYLKKRKQLGPEEKYPLPVLSSWEYGWRLGEVVKEIKPPVHGRSSIVQEHFYRNNGVFVTSSFSDRLLVS